MIRSAAPFLAIALGVVAWNWNPLPAGDPLRSLLSVAPIVAGALALFWRGMGESAAAGRSGLRPSGKAEICCLGALLLAVTYRQTLGLQGFEGALVGALALLLLTHVSRRLTPLTHLLARWPGGRTPVAFFLLPALVYLAILPWQLQHHEPSGDEPYYLLVTHSLAWDGDLNLANNYAVQDSLAFMDRAIEPQKGDPVGEHGEIYSRHSRWLPLLLAPAYRLAGLPGAAAMLSLLTAGVCWSTVWLARGLFPELSAGTVVAWAVVSFTVPLLLYSYRFWAEVPAALALTLVSGGIVRLRADNTRARRLLLIGALLLVAVLLKNRFALVAAPLALLAAWRSTRRPRSLVYGALAALAAGVVILAANALVFGHPLIYHEWRELNLLRFPPKNYLRGFVGLFFDRSFGLFAYAPIWMLLLVAVPRALVRCRSYLLLMLCWVPYLIVLTPRGQWFGAFSPPFRYGLAWLPLLAVGLVPLAVERLRRRPLVWLLLGATVVLTVIVLVRPEWGLNLPRTNHLLARLSMRLGTDVARFFPDFATPAACDWILAALLASAALLLYPLRAREVHTAKAWGVVGLLLVAGGGMVAARAMPTRRVEMQAVWIQHQGGEAYPDPWSGTFHARRLGWVLYPGDAVRVPLVSGGECLSVRAYMRRTAKRPARLEIGPAGGELELWAGWLPPEGRREEVILKATRWEEDRALVLRVPAQVGKARGRPQVPPPLFIERLELTWSAADGGSTAQC